MSRDYLNDNNRIVKKRNHNKIKNTYQKGKGLNLEYPNIRIIENNYVFTENSDKMLNNNYIQTLEKPVYNSDMYSSIFVRTTGGGQKIDLLNTLKKIKYKNKKDSYVRYKYIDNNNNQITSGGILFYRINNNVKEFLLIENKDRNKYEDFGGCVEDKDKNIYETIKRELLEESNDIFSKYLSEIEINNLINKSDRLYNKNNKYLLLISLIPNEMKNISLKKFGTKENHDNINRVLKWIPEDKLLNRDFRNNLNYRLLFKDFLNYLYSTKKEIKIVEPKNKIVINRFNIDNIKILVDNIDLWTNITNKLINFLDNLIINKNLKYDIKFLTKFIDNYDLMFNCLDKLIDSYLKLSESISMQEKYQISLNMTYFKKYYDNFNNDIKKFINNNDYKKLQQFYNINTMDIYLKNILEKKFL